MDFLSDKFKIENIDNIGITGLTNQLISFCVNGILKDKKRDIILITSTLYEANIIYSSLSKINKNTYLFPMDDFLTSEALAIFPELKSIRLNTLNMLETNTNNIVITNLMGYLRYLPSSDLWNKSKIIIKKEIEIKKEDLYNHLSNIGYSTVTLVNKTGEIANRGFILDIYPSNMDYPIRVEFWGDFIESIRLFDPDTQRSLEEIETVKITPYSEFINEKNIVGIEEKQKYLPYVVNNLSSISSYLNNPITIYKDYNQLKNSYKNLREEIFNFSKEKNEIYDTNYMFEFESLIKNKDNIYLMTIDNIIDHIKLNNTYNFTSRIIENFNSNFDRLNEFLQICILKKKKTIISISNKDYINHIKKFLKVSNIFTNINDLHDDVINIVNENIDQGFEFLNYVVITENEIFKNQNKNINYKNKFRYGVKLKNIESLNVGDYVVHLNHGIGIYSGITTLVKNGNKKDYIEVLYKDNDKLYIPVEKIELLSKYSSNEGIVPKINKLGSVEWEKTKLRVKGRIKDIADKLLKLSAERKMKPGFAFKDDDEDQIKFESEFKYNLTKDQFIAISKIKEDMEKSTPMDMLLCGDVGYGKTEVAFRAIFKAINSGKQVAYLCPTTILSNQQYKNALDRFSNFAINIALLNRFTPKNEVKEILNNIKEGKIDLLFGTHRMLSNDVKFKDLGLLVIDEEQRFGVTHKEKIKEYKSNIDILTLSATPIPRTLQMSLVGIRNMALIETPPIDRYPIQTYVIEESNQLIREAIYKEMSRGGQIFILFNSVEHIEEKLNEINKLVPEAKIRFAHGKMTKNQIENTMFGFINNEFDILLCTTIIETGIDIPNVNTLIIYDADKFGLSQLYQIRGRVGRSNKIAYAYLMYSKNKILNEVAVKRLNAIKEFTELGSGFQIAMRDLSIRGAGDILGSEQAGFIDTVGYELYVKMLNDEVMHLKGIQTKEEIKEEEKPLIEVETHIKNDYVMDNSLKIEIHKKINDIESYDDLLNVRKELEDRFGKIDSELDIYMHEIWFEKLAKLCLVYKVNKTDLFVEIVFEKGITSVINVDELFIIASDISLNYKISYIDEKLHIKLILNNLRKHYIYYLTDLLSKITNKMV